MIRPSSCSGIWQPCQPVRSLNVPQTRGKYHVSSSGWKPSGRSCGRRIQVSSGSRPVGVRPAVAVDQLPGRGHADRLGVERELLRVLDEVEQVGVRAAELVLAVHAERVVPDDPTAAGQSLCSRWSMTFSSAAYSSPMASQNVPVGLEHADHLGDPLAAPVEVLLALQPVVVRRRTRSRC